MKRAGTMIGWALATLLGCGSDSPEEGEVATDTGEETSDTAAELTEADTAGDTSEEATSPPEVVDTDTAPDTAIDTVEPETGASTYLLGCESLFAARVVELQIERDATFPSDCGEPLRDDIGELRRGGKPICVPGESANGCRRRIYESPPPLGDLTLGCASDPDAVSCLRGRWVARCADGSDDGCDEPDAVCQDGTRPIIMAEAATSGPSDRWIFFLGGEGGPCFGSRCWVNYRYAHLVGDATSERAMSTVHPQHGGRAATAGGGVISGRAPAENPFASMNRVRFERCSDAASDAVETVELADGIPPEAADRFPGVPVATHFSSAPVWHRGLSTWKAAFNMLTRREHRDLDGDGEPDLPSLADARQVVLGGSSDASVWIIFAADALAEELRAIAGADVDVRIMLDGYFESALDNSGRYHPDAPAGFDLFTHPYGTTGLCRLPDNRDGVDNEACSNATYRPEGGIHNAYTARNVARDASCEAHHGQGAPECFDKIHTLLHHVSAPFLVLADQEDQTIKDVTPPFADDRSYFWDAPATYRAPVLDQAVDIVTSWSTDAREDGAGQLGDAVLILPKSRRDGQGWGQARHVRMGDDAEMQKGMTLCDSGGDRVVTISFAEMIGTWLADELPVYFAMEDASRWDGDTNFWVSGDRCRAPE